MPEHMAEEANARILEDAKVISGERRYKKVTNKIAFNKTASVTRVIWPLAESRSKRREPGLMPKKIVK